MYAADLETTAEIDAESGTVSDGAIEGIVEIVTADNYYQFEQQTAMQIGDGFAVLIFAVGAAVGCHMVKLLVGRWFV